MNKLCKVFALFCLSLIHFLFYVRVSTASPTVNPPSELFSFGQRLESQETWTPHGHEQNTISLSPTAKSRAPEKRMLTDFDPTTVQMKMLTFKTVQALTPIVGAARFLEGFYSGIALKAGGAWQSQPRQDSITITQGPVSLVLTSMGDTIPWDFVKTMAERMWEIACMGAADLFDAVYASEGGKIAVAVSLRLVDDTSGSSSGTDYREGSVPSVGSPFD